ncbi:MAG: DUF342 domain-containing protein [Gammaproteobacteria bacterium]|nr:DUF342 domain-containing protein [Gammaproteobacteria bacterium]
MSDLVASFIVEPVLSTDETKVSLRATARMINKSVHKPVIPESIIELLKNRGYGKFKTDANQIDEITSAFSEALDQVTNEDDIKGLSFETDTIAEAIDAIGEVDIPKDKLTARLTITSAQGGRPLTLDATEALLKDAGVTYGIDTDTISALISESRQKEGLEKCSGEVAFALLPVAGEDAKFVPLVETANERILRPRLRADGTVDMLDLGDLPTVREGTPIMQKEPPTKGTKGINVCWEFLAAAAGKDIKYKPGPGTRISDEDELILLSTISGQPNLLDCGMKVDDVVQVKSVDLHTGHMKLDANLIVKGDIAEGMKVRCEGDITVGGVVESADVRAKGNIIIGKGILGRTADYGHKDHSTTVSVRAGGDISAMFASYAKLEANGDIKVSEQLLHCDTKCEGAVVVGNEKTVGSQIVGGITRSSKSIDADILGASAGVFTSFDLSGPFNVKHYEVVCNRSIIDGKSTLLKNMRDAYSQFVSIQTSSARTSYIDKIKNTISHLEKEIKEFEERDIVLQAECEKFCHGLTIRAKHKIQPNVSVKIGHERFKTSKIREAGVILYEEGSVIYRPGLDH